MQVKLHNHFSFISFTLSSEKKTLDYNITNITIL